MDERPFTDLPGALVEDVLSQTTEVGDRLLEEFHKVRRDRDTLRKQLSEHDLILSETSLGYPPLPTTCATDGSYAIEHLLSVDLAAAAAVAVEGLTPPSEKRYWSETRHSTFVAAEVHHAETATILRAVMLGQELTLATQAPHDLVMLDGTLTLPIIYFNQALNQAPYKPDLQCARRFLDNCEDYLEAYRSLLRADRSDRQYIALPKYSTRSEIGHELGWENHDDRGLLTLLLQPGELTRPRPLEPPEQEWHLYTSGLKESGKKDRVDEMADDIVAALNRVHIFYYKPHDWLPALRVETSAGIALNTHRLATVVQGLKHQCATAAMLEPYPIYLADRTVKALARAIPAFRQVATQRVSERYDGDIGEVFFAMHGYRSEGGV